MKKIIVLLLASFCFFGEAEKVKVPVGLVAESYPLNFGLSYKGKTDVDLYLYHDISDGLLLDVPKMFKDLTSFYPRFSVGYMNKDFNHFYFVKVDMLLLRIYDFVNIGVIGSFNLDGQSVDVNGVGQFYASAKFFNYFYRTSLFMPYVAVGTKSLNINNLDKDKLLAEFKGLVKEKNLSFGLYYDLDFTTSGVALSIETNAKDYASLIVHFDFK